MITIPIFYAADDNYAAPLSVSIASIQKSASKNYIYDIRVLSSGMNSENKRLLEGMASDNINVSLVDITEALADSKSSLSHLRDYYSESIYYRLFIPRLYPELCRAVYIDCDTVVLRDIAELYFTDIGDKLLGAVPDECISYIEEFKQYVESWVGVPHGSYFNSGVLVMNLDELRCENIPEQIFESIKRYDLETVAPDQDYLNAFCLGRVHYLHSSWNKQPNHESYIHPAHLSLIHFNMFNKPWHYRGVLYENEFWKCAAESEYYDRLLATRDGFSEEDREADIAATVKLIRTAGELAEREGGFSEIVKGAALTK